MTYCNYDKFYQWLAIINLDVFNKVILNETENPISSIEQSFSYKDEIKNVLRPFNSDYLKFGYVLTPQEYERLKELFIERYDYGFGKIRGLIFNNQIDDACEQVVSEDTDLSTDCDTEFWKELYKLNIQYFFSDMERYEMIIDKIVKQETVPRFAIPEDNNIVSELLAEGELIIPCLWNEEKRYEIFDKLIDNEARVLDIQSYGAETRKQFEELMNDYVDYSLFYKWFAEINMKLINYIIKDLNFSMKREIDTPYTLEPITYSECYKIVDGPDSTKEMCFGYEINSTTDVQIRLMLQCLKCKDMDEFLDKWVKKHSDNKILAREASKVNVRTFLNCSTEDYSDKLDALVGIKNNPYTF